MHMVRYTVHPQHAAQNEELVRAIIDELGELQPAGLRYAAFKLEDGVSFIHLISHDADRGHLPGPELDALRAFHVGLRERCAEPPVRTELTLLGAVRLLDRSTPCGAQSRPHHR